MGGSLPNKKPNWNIREAHNALAFKILAEKVKNWHLPKIHPNLPHSNQMLIALENQLDTIEPETVLLVSEVLSNFGKDVPAQIPRLRSRLSIAEDFHIWCTLRRPDEQIASWYGQAIRMGISLKPLWNAESGINYNGLHFDYKGVV